MPGSLNVQIHMARAGLSQARPKLRVVPLLRGSWYCCVRLECSQVAPVLA